MLEVILRPIEHDCLGLGSSKLYILKLPFMILMPSEYGESLLYNYQNLDALGRLLPC